MHFGTSGKRIKEEEKRRGEGADVGLALSLQKADAGIEQQRLHSAR